MPEDEIVVHLPSLPPVQGFCHVLGGLQKLGLLNEARHQRLEAEAAPLRWVGAGCSLLFV